MRVYPPPLITAASLAPSLPPILLVFHRIPQAAACAWAAPFALGAVVGAVACSLLLLPLALAPLDAQGGDEGLLLQSHADTWQEGQGAWQGGAAAPWDQRVVRHPHASAASSALPLAPLAAAVDSGSARASGGAAGESDGDTDAGEARAGEAGMRDVQGRHPAVRALVEANGQVMRQQQQAVAVAEEDERGMHAVLSTALQELERERLMPHGTVSLVQPESLAALAEAVRARQEEAQRAGAEGQAAGNAADAVQAAEQAVLGAVAAGGEQTADFSSLVSAAQAAGHVGRMGHGAAGASAGEGQGEDAAEGEIWGGGREGVRRCMVLQCAVERQQLAVAAARLQAASASLAAAQSALDSSERQLWLRCGVQAGGMAWEERHDGELQRYRAVAGAAFDKWCVAWEEARPSHRLTAALTAPPHLWWHGGSWDGEQGADLLSAAGRSRSSTARISGGSSGAPAGGAAPSCLRLHTAPHAPAAAAAAATSPPNPTPDAETSPSAPRMGAPLAELLLLLSPVSTHAGQQVDGQGEGQPSDEQWGEGQQAGGVEAWQAAGRSIDPQHMLVLPLVAPHAHGAAVAVSGAEGGGGEAAEGDGARAAGMVPMAEWEGFDLLARAATGRLLLLLTWRDLPAVMHGAGEEGCKWLEQLTAGMTEDGRMGVVGVRTSRVERGVGRAEEEGESRQGEWEGEVGGGAVLAAMAQWGAVGKEGKDGAGLSGSGDAGKGAAGGRLEAGRRLTGYVDGTPLLVRRHALMTLGGLGLAPGAPAAGPAAAVAGWALCTRMWLAGFKVSRITSHALQPFATSPSDPRLLLGHAFHISQLTQAALYAQFYNDFTASTTAAVAMASPPVLAFDAEGRPVKFETWLDDLHLFLQLTAKEDITLYDHALGHATAPLATAPPAERSQWQTRDAHARFAIRNSLPLDEREHFGQCKTAKDLYTAVVARYSSPASATLGRLTLPYLFPDLASFHTVADLITHLKTSEARFRAAMPDEFLASNPPPLWITLYHVVTRLPDSLRPAPLVATPAAPSLRGAPLPPSSPLSPLLLLSTSLVLRRSGLRLLQADDAGAGVAGVGVVAEEAGVEVVAVEVRLERLVAAVVEVTAALGVVTGAEVAAEAEVVVAAAGVEVAAAEAEGVVVVEARGAYVIRTGDRTGQTCGGPHQTERCFARLNDAWRTQFPGGVERVLSTCVFRPTRAFRPAPLLL
ncbi:unnamed protein product [Closterium sp. Yama58-4]|nr:unnamed protein product [Closterium sp. Yama58-4]